MTCSIECPAVGHSWLGPLRRSNQSAEAGWPEGPVTWLWQVPGHPACSLLTGGSADESVFQVDFRGWENLEVRDLFSRVKRPSCERALGGRDEETNGLFSQPHRGTGEETHMFPHDDPI